MLYRFNAVEWATLSPGERVKRCRIMAYEASELGRAAKTLNMKSMYLRLAEDWQGLAKEIEREISTSGSPTSH
jgi:hypothetical protein